MNFRTTYILFGAVALILVVFLLMLAFGPSGDADDYVLSAIRETIGKKGDKQKDVIKSITRFEIERLSPSGETLVFTRTTDGWKLEMPYEAKIDGKVIEDAVSRLVEARIDRKADITHRLAELGLDSPSIIITLRHGDKEKDTHWIKLGNVSAGSGAVVFALTKERGKNEPIAIRKNDLDGLFKAAAKDAATAGEALKSISDFRPRGLLAGGSPLAWDIVNRIYLKEGTKEITLNKEDGNWRFIKPEDYGPADPEGDPTPLGPAAENIAGVKPLLTVLTGLRLGDATGDVIENPSKYEEFGLESDKETMRVELRLTTGEVEVLRFGKKDGDRIAARLGNESFVVKLPDKSLDPIRKLLGNPKAMRDRSLLHLTQAGIDAIDVKLANEQKFELRLCGTPRVWRLFEEGGGDAHELASSAAVQALLAKLTERRSIKDFPDSGAGDNAYGLDVPAVEISLWQNGIIPEKKDEKKDEKEAEKPKAETVPKMEEVPPVKRPSLLGEPTVKLKFGKKDNERVYVRRYLGTFSTLVALPEGTLAVVNHSATEYLDPTLPSFDRTKVIKASVQRGTEKIEVEKEKSDPASPIWKLLQPANLAGRTAIADKVDRAVFALNTMQPAKMVATRASGADLERYGLKTPKTVVTIILKDAKDPFSYSFGNETEDKKFYYARVGGKERVYRVAKDIVDALLDGDLEDPTIFRLAAARVNSIKFTGLKDPPTLEFVRKNDKEWTVKDKPEFVVDNEKFGGFVASLELVRADRILTGGPLPEHKLDAKDGSLILEIALDNEKDPIVVSVGSVEKGGKTYFATSNRMPGVVFLLFKDRFKEMREKPTYFKKM